MNLRAIGVAVAVVLAIACRTAGTKSSEGSGTAQAPPADTYGTSGTAQAPPAGERGGAAGQDPLVVPGPAIKGHASDQVVAGEIGRVSGSSLTISILSPPGDSKTLQIAPETSITIEGMDASAADLQEGQRVVASFNQVEGRDVAVEIEARGGGSESSSTAPSGAEGTGSSGDAGAGSAAGSAGSSSDSGTSGTGTSSEPPSPTDSSGR